MNARQRREFRRALERLGALENASLEVAKSMPTTKRDKVPKASTLALLRNMAIGSVVLAFVGILLATSLPPWVFWAATCFAAVAFVVSLLDIWKESWGTWQKTLATTILSPAALIFFWFVLTPAKIAVVADSLAKNDADNEGKIGGQSWSPFYHEVRIFVANNLSNQVFTDLKIELQTDLSIATIVQTLGPTCRIDRNLQSSPPIIVTSWPQWHIQCDKLQPGDALDFAIGVVTLDRSTATAFINGIPLDAKFSPPQEPKMVFVKTEYRSALGRPRVQHGGFPSQSFHEIGMPYFWKSRSKNLASIFALTVVSPEECGRVVGQFQVLLHEM